MGGGEATPEVVGLSSNPVMTTSCVRHCAKGEWWGVKRGWEEVGDREVWVSRRIGVGVLHKPNAPPHDSLSHPRPPCQADIFQCRQLTADAAPFPLLHPASAPGFTLHQVAELAAPSEKPKGAAASPPPAPGKQQPTQHSLPLAVPPQWCWIPTEPQASLGCHLLPYPWSPGDAWTSLAGG